MQKKILISGYYGFDNFGDDTILQVLVSELKNNLKDWDITVISNNPEKVSLNYGVHSVYKFDFKSIFREMKTSGLFISGGGSLLQDVTSFKSLLYYLFLIFMAQVFRLKTCIFAQGIGPINNKIGKLLAKIILKKVNLITVRDSVSHEFLEGLGIKSTLTADPVWNVEYPGENKSNDKINVGVQLREWYSLDDEKLKELARALSDNFNDEKYRLSLISLQDSRDLEITKKFKSFLATDIDSVIVSDLNIQRALSALNHLDFLIGMRFHADLITIKFNIPTLAISYDPKVESLAREANIPYVDINSLNYSEINLKIRELVDKCEEICKNLEGFSARKSSEARQNIDLLIKMVK